MYVCSLTWQNFEIQMNLKEVFHLYIFHKTMSYLAFQGVRSLAGGHGRGPFDVRAIVTLISTDKAH